MSFLFKRNSAVKKAHLNTIFGSSALFDLVNDPQFEQLLAESKRENLKSLGKSETTLFKLLDEKGYTGLPIQVSQNEYDFLISSGLTQIYRGVRIPNAQCDYNNNENMFVGHGKYLNGVYFMYGEQALSKVKGYAAIPPKQTVENFKVNELSNYFNNVSGSSYVTALLASDAKVIDLSELVKLKRKYFNEINNQTSISNETKIKVYEMLSTDISKIAVIEGWDAVRLHPTKELVVLNRTKTIVPKVDDRIKH